MDGRHLGGRGGSSIRQATLTGSASLLVIEARAVASDFKWEGRGMNHVSQKLDPRLWEIVQRSDRGETPPSMVDVMIGLDAPLTAEARADLTSRGLVLRSELGTVLTGSIVPGLVRVLAESPRVLRIEAGAPMFLEGGGADG